MTHDYEAIRAEVLAVAARYLELAALVGDEHPILAYQLREGARRGRKIAAATRLRIADLATAGGEMSDG